MPKFYILRFCFTLKTRKLLRISIIQANYQPEVVFGFRIWIRSGSQTRICEGFYTDSAIFDQCSVLLDRESVDDSRHGLSQWRSDFRVIPPVASLPGYASTVLNLWQVQERRSLKFELFEPQRFKHS